MESPLYPYFRKRILDALKNLEKDQVLPWYVAFQNSAAPTEFKIKKHDGTEICFQGVKYKGAPREVFWSNYIEPFIEEIIVNEVDEAIKLSQEKDTDTIELLEEIQSLFWFKILELFKYMEDVEFYIQLGEPLDDEDYRSIDKEIDTMREFNRTHIGNKILLCKKRQKRGALIKKLNRWWKN